MTQISTHIFPTRRSSDLYLRDIETEGYTVRIGQLLEEEDPLLRDLDGDRLAIERRYIEQDVDGALRASRSEEHTSELQSPCNVVCRLLLEKTKRLHHQRS